MSDDSTEAGPLAPVTDGVIFVGTGPITFEGDGPIEFDGPGDTPPLEDDELDDFMQALVVGISGLDATLVRPRWQEEPPNLPARSVNWAAIGVMNRRHEQYAYVEHDPAGEGWDRITRNEQLEVLVSFYGPNCQGVGARFRDGLAVAQNREPLLLANMGISDVGDLQRAPELIKNAFYKRADLQFVVGRQIIRTYAVRSIVAAHATVQGGPTTNTIDVNP